MAVPPLGNEPATLELQVQFLNQYATYDTLPPKQVHI